MTSRSCYLLLLCSVFALALVLADDAPTDGSLPLSAADGVANPTIPDPRTTIYEFVRQSEVHTILFRLIDSNEQSKEFLNNKGARFTLFAPVDNAFIRLANSLTPGVTVDQQTDADDVIAAIAAAIEQIREVTNFAAASDIVIYHVLEGAFPIEDLIEMGTATTVLGRPRNLTFFDGNVVVDADDSRNNATANPTNIFALNGWIHQIYGVLLPFQLDEAVTLITSRPTPAAVTPIVTPTPVSGEQVTEEETSEEETTEEGEDADDGDGDEDPSTVITEDGAAPTPDDDDDDDDDDEVCFPASATVTTADGSTVRMADLEAGQHIQHDEHGASSPVFLFTHRTLKREQWFYRISTASGHAVSITGNHYLYVNERLVAAHAVQVGNVVRTMSGPSAVVKVERVKDVGLYAPHSLHGDVVVDGIVCSSYSRAVAPGLAHALLLPLRWFVRASGAREVLPGVFYEGGRGLERFVPKGLAAY
ncbi:Desert hedgehog protein A [Gracilariopsis chorda]|uniref:Desert hedgehog protein A n=1 Tax=Gracilariopsis chorda TaxID=448386 RepID=A0A2V3IE18_9FLOR|nr:Desert hedgehog protein A [Gracilariopsis chorda]|eukprot:PXF40307.1 Desert hedgehog protein A [Gracilariopsis chorda]